MESMQQTLVVFCVLALLGGTLYWLRSRGLARFSFRPSGGTKTRRMQTIDRLSLTPQHSLHLVRVAGRVLLIAVSPGGSSVIDGGTWDLAEGENAKLR